MRACKYTLYGFVISKKTPKTNKLGTKYEHKYYRIEIRLISQIINLSIS